MITEDLIISLNNCAGSGSHSLLPLSLQHHKAAVKGETPLPSPWLRPHGCTRSSGPWVCSVGCVSSHISKPGNKIEAKMEVSPWSSSLGGRTSCVTAATPDTENVHSSWKSPCCFSAENPCNHHVTKLGMGGFAQFQFHVIQIRPFWLTHLGTVLYNIFRSSKTFRKRNISRMIPS